MALLGCNPEPLVIDDASSPDGAHHAVIFTTDPIAATSSLHTSVSILHAADGEPEWPPNAFTATHGAERTPTGPYNGPRLSVAWRGTDTLVIVHDSRVAIVRRNELVDGVHVVYRPTVLPDDAAAVRGEP